MTALLRLLLLLLPTLGHAATLPLQASETPILPGPAMHVWADPLGQADIHSVRQLPATAWQPVARRDASFGYSKHAYWLRLNLHNPSDTPINWILLIGNPLLDTLDAYGLDGERVYEAGDQRPFHQRWINHRQLALPFSLNAGEERQLFLRMQTDGSANLSASLMSAEAFNHHEQRMLLLQGLFFGALLVMIIYNLSIFIITHDRNYLWYSLFVASFSLYQFIQLGFALQWLWPESLAWHQRSFPFSSALATFFGILFTHGVLDLKSRHHAYTWICRLLLGASLLVMLLALSGPYSVALIGSFALLLACAVFGGIFTTLRWRDGYPPAKLFALGWSMLIIASLFSVISGTGLIANSLLTLHAQQIGSLLELVIFSIALGLRIRLIQRAEKVAQAKLLANAHQLRQEQAKSLELQQQINGGLEARVKERTASLQQALQELSMANQQLAELSRHDNLTGLFNRQVLNEELERMLAQAKRSQQPLAVLMMDLDHFKRVNDAYGHLVGDACLQHAAQRMLQRMRRNDLLVRFGGEEFAAVLCDTTTDGAIDLAEELREDVASHPCVHQDLNVELSLSIGVYALTPEADCDREQLLRNADKALYRAKANGRNRVESYQPEKPEEG
ncbi:GGDEF domain-containing protein [Pseudomonas sp. HMWF032]|uniref:sensor domain-containing diguanylate cyclase n=1 Tax=Pseudomonas sp. HMWF032 TaxID=2056866 RepID=UPI0021154D29|nr:GGDEF domain-containing protein [Pseudomonas sp. HMWF032]